MMTILMTVMEITEVHTKVMYQEYKLKHNIHMYWSYQLYQASEKNCSDFSHMEHSMNL